MGLTYTLDSLHTVGETVGEVSASWYADTMKTSRCTCVRGKRTVWKSGEHYLAEVSPRAPGRGVIPIRPQSTTIRAKFCVKLQTTPATIRMSRRKVALSQSGQVDFRSCWKRTPTFFTWRANLRWRRNVCSCRWGGGEHCKEVFIPTPLKR